MAANTAGFSTIALCVLTWSAVASEDVGSGLAHRLPNAAGVNKTSSVRSGCPLERQRFPDVRKSHEIGHANASLVSMSKIMSLLPPTFTLASDKIADERCRRDNEIYLRQLSQLKLWALKIHDSGGKLTSGILNGNVNQFGDFDQCVSARDGESDVSGKYCLARFQIRIKDATSRAGAEAEKILNLAHSHYPMRSELSNSAHRIPSLSAVNWAVCVPSSCSHDEIRVQLHDAARYYTEGTPLDVDLRLDRESCSVKESFRPPASFVVVSSLFAFVAALAIASTAKDYAGRRSRSFRDEFLHCFSLRRNVRQLTSTERHSEDIACIHGIRMFSAVMLFLSHKSIALLFFPYANRTRMVENITKPWTSVIRMAHLYTDSFIMMSGILASYSLSKSLETNGRINVKSEYLNRLVRVFPLLAATILISTFVLPELGSGPQWGSTVEQHAKYCKESWWRNFLFVHNYWGFENMCLTHTHHIGIDTQLFFLSPLLVYVLHRWRATGFGVLVALAAASTALRYRMALAKNLSYFIYPGISVNQMMDTANFSYIIPSHRLTAYIMGLVTGHVLRHAGREYGMKRRTRRLWWMTAFISAYYIVSKAVSMSTSSYVYDKYEAAAYSGLVPVAWCLAHGWIIFAAHTNHGGIIGRILSSKYCMIWTRISYAVYLIQFPVFFFVVGEQRYAEEYRPQILVNVFVFASVLTASVLLTLLVDMPCTNIRKLVNGRSRSRDRTGNEGGVAETELKKN